MRLVFAADMYGFVVADFLLQVVVHRHRHHQRRLLRHLLPWAALVQVQVREPPTCLPS